MKFIKCFCLVFFIALSSCGNDDNGNEKNGGRDDTPYYVFTDIKDIFGFYGQNRYSYCPSLVKEDDGTVHMYFCGNPNQGVMVDNIYYMRINPDGSKTARAHAVTPLFEAGNVYIPHPQSCEWVKDYEAELLQFPAAAHDDQVDATTQALRRMIRKPGLNFSLANLKRKRGKK